MSGPHLKTHFKFPFLTNCTSLSWTKPLSGQFQKPIQCIHRVGPYCPSPANNGLLSAFLSFSLAWSSPSSPLLPLFCPHPWNCPCILLTHSDSQRLHFQGSQDSQPHSFLSSLQFASTLLPLPASAPAAAATASQPLAPPNTAELALLFSVSQRRPEAA